MRSDCGILGNFSNIREGNLQIYGGQSLYFVFENVSQKPNTTSRASPTINGIRTGLSVDFLYVFESISKSPLIRFPLRGTHSENYSY
jgi:hypothetical protein